MSESGPPKVYGRLLGGLRLASALVATAVLGVLAIPAQLGVQPFHPVSLVALALMLAISLAGVLLAAQQRGWGAARLPVAVFVLLVVVIEAALLPGAALVTTEHQTFAAVGWVWVMLFVDVALAPLLVALAAHQGATLALLVHADRWDVPTIVNLLLVTTGAIGFQTMLGAAGGALRGVASAAVAAAARNARLATAEDIARQLHADRGRRYDDLRGTVLPLLRTLANGTAAPGDRGVQRRAAQEAARLRRLFAEDDDLPDLLLNELTPVIAMAERRGVVVQQSLLGSRPPAPLAVRRVLLDALTCVLARAEGTARVTVTGTVDTLTLGVVAYAPGAPLVDRSVDGVRISSVVEEGRVWTQARWTAS